MIGCKGGGTSPLPTLFSDTFKYLRFFPATMSPENTEYQIPQELQAIRKLLEEIDKNINVIAMKSQHRMVIGDRVVW